MRGRITTVKRRKPEQKLAKGCGSGFGFLIDEQNITRFFNHNAVEGIDFDQLQEGQEVEFEPFQDTAREPGKDQRARRVRLAS